MKRLLLALTILLVACGVHENISKDMVNDTNDIIKIIETSIKKDRDLTDRETKKMESFQIKYSVKDLTEEENRLFILVDKLIDNYDYYAYLETDSDYLDEQKEYINNVIKTGKMFKE